MFFKKNIWLIYYSLLLLGFVYLALSSYTRWQELERTHFNELSYLNQVFSSSVSTNLDQYEITLDLLGQKLLSTEPPLDRETGTRVLDRVLQQNQSINGFGLANLDGVITIASSNLNLDKMPNLRQNPVSRGTFIGAINARQMILGHTYYLEALQDWVIPIRKGIRDLDDSVLGVMAAGIAPQRLLPKLNPNTLDATTPYRFMLVHDESYHYAYISGIDDHNLLATLIDNPIPSKTLQAHDQALLTQHEVTLDSLRNREFSIEYVAPGIDDQANLFSAIYIPKYRLWAYAFLGYEMLTTQLTRSLILYTLTYLLVFGVIFLLFRSIYAVEQRKQQQLLSQATHDFLTGLYNRQYLAQAEGHWIGPGAAGFMVLFIDLDNFKHINDSYGHSYGDLILIEVARRLRGQLGGNHLLCRQGGDEFIILAPESGIGDIGKYCERILQQLAAPYHIEHYDFIIGASIGVACYPRDGSDFETLFSAADSAMYRAKAKKNSYCVFSDELHQQSLLAGKIEQAFHSALQNDEFYLLYQPQLNPDGSLYGIEALVRWHSASLGALMPNQFIGIAEDGGFIVPLGEFIIDRALGDFAGLANIRSCAQCRLSINVSIRQLQAEHFCDHVAAALARHAVPASRVTLEITEGIFIEDRDYLMPILQALRTMGCSFSLDDFGTGYSSLSMLRDLPIDELKIDKSFTDQLLTSDEGKAMVLNIINIAKNLGLQVIAEGTETPNQCELLKQLGCDAQQGYHFARPMKVEEIKPFIELQRH